MLIEHTFVTTLEATPALALASDFLQRMGFTVIPQTGFQIGSTTLSELELTRGKPRKPYIEECFQQVRLEFDRGRVNVALSIQPRPRSGFALSRQTMPEIKPTSKLGKPYADLMLTLAQAIDELLAGRKALKDVLAEYRAKELSIANYVRRGRRHSRIVRILIILAIVILLIAIGVMFADMY